MLKRRALSAGFSLLLVAGLLAGLALLIQPAPPARADVALPPVAVGEQPLAVAVNPNTNKIYVANYASNDVTAIDGATLVTTTVPVGAMPPAVAVNATTNKVYVLNLGSNNVTVIDGATLGTTAVAAGVAPVAVAVNPVTNKVYVSNRDSGNVTVIDGVTLSTTVVASHTSPLNLAVNQLTNKIYVTNPGNNNVTVIDGATNGTTTVVAGAFPRDVAVNPVTNKIYVANQDSNNMTVIDGATNLTTTVPVGKGPVAVAINPVTNKIYVANRGSNNVTVIDGATNGTTTVDTWVPPWGGAPTAVAANPMTNKVYVANVNARNVTVIDGATNTVAAVIATGTTPQAVAVNPVTNRIYVANNSSCDVTVIEAHPLAASIKSVNQLSVFPGSSLTYAITLSNTDRADILDAAVTDTLPAELSYSPASLAAPSGVYTYTDGVIQWSGAVNAGESLTIIFGATVNGTASLGDLVNTVVISSGGQAITRAATTTVLNPLLSSTKTIDRSTAWPGSSLTYTITLTNASSLDLPNVTVTDTLPADLSYSDGSLTAPSGDFSYADGVIHWAGVVSAGGSLPITFGTTVKDTASLGNLVNAAVIGSGGQTITRTATTTIFNPLISSAKSVDRASALPGSLLTYTIALTNTDTADQTGVIVTDTLPAGLSYSPGSLAAPSGAYGYDNGAIHWSGTVPAGGTVTISYTALVDLTAAPGSLVNAALIDGGGQIITRTAVAKVPYRFYLPFLVRKTCSTGICGRVTVNGSPAAGVSLQLRFYDGSAWSTRATRTTGSDGSYAFAGMPALGAGQGYYVLYQNSAGTGGRLWVWGTPLLTSYAAGSNVEMAVFDIADIPLASPASGTTVSLPYTFQWTRRPATPTDSYEFDLFDMDDLDPYAYSPHLGYVSGFTVSQLPAGFMPNTAYGWDVWVYSPDGGYGISYWARWVTFSNSGSSQGAAGESMPVHPKNLPEVLLGHPEPESR